MKLGRTKKCVDVFRIQTGDLMLSTGNQPHARQESDSW